MFLNLQSNVPHPPFHRIISLVPSISELLADLGLDNEVVGITKFCVRPDRWYRGKARIGGTKNLNVPMIQELKPDLIIANKEENNKEEVEKLALSYTVMLTDIHDLHDALKMIGDIGKVTNTVSRCSYLIEEIKAGFKELPSSPEDNIPAAYFIWRNPYMVAGGDTFIDAMMRCCGLENIFSEKARYPGIQLEELDRLGCYTVLLSSEPYPFKEKHIRELQEHTPAVQVLCVDGEMFSWYGSRLVKAPAYFKSLMHEIRG